MSNETGPFFATTYSMTYSIRPAVREDGTPVYELVQSIDTVLGSSFIRIATNRDRSVLERAIEHLQQPAT
jgi:hypothetical protein